MLPKSNVPANAGNGEALMIDYLLLTDPYLQLLTQSNVLAAFALAVSIIALSFMAGEMFSLPSVKGFAKSELYELGVSAVVLVIAVLLIMPNGPFDMVTGGFLSNSYPHFQVCEEWRNLHGPYEGGPYDGYFKDGNIAFGQAEYFLGCKPDFMNLLTAVPPIPFVGTDGIMLSKLTSAYWSSMLNEMFLGFLSGLYISFPIPLPGEMFRLDISTVPFGSLTLLNDIHTLIVDFVGMLWAAFAAQKLLLNFIEQSAIQVFLPLGLLMRALPFTRRTGSTIIAVAFAAYFVFPLSILVNQQIWEAIVSPTVPPGATCLGVGITCATNNDCCTGECRGDGSGASACAVPMTDFHEYMSTYALCYGKDKTSIAGDIQNTALDFAGRVDSAYFNPTTPISEPEEGKGWSRFVTSANEEKRKAEIMLQDSPGDLWILPTPQRANNAFFMMVEALLVDTARFMMVALLFIVLEIVITLTLMKDFALMIGGEPRIFGITKLA